MGDTKLAKGKTTGPLTPIAAVCMWPLVGAAIVWFTVTVNILVSLLKTSVAVPVAVEALAGTSFAPDKVAVNVIFGFGGAGSSLLLQETATDKISVIAKNLNNTFIVFFF